MIPGERGDNLIKIFYEVANIHKFEKNKGKKRKKKKYLMAKTKKQKKKKKVRKESTE